MGNEAPRVARRAQRHPPIGCEPEAKERSPIEGLATALRAKRRQPVLAKREVPDTMPQFERCWCVSTSRAIVLLI